MFKLSLSSTFFFVSLILFLLSCHKHDIPPSGTLTLSKSAIRLDTATGNQDSLTVQSTVPWTAKLSSPADWLRLSITSGAAGNTVVRLTILSNNATADPQTVSIIFSAANNPAIPAVTLTVTQKPYTFSLGYRKALGGTNSDGIVNSVIRTPDGGTVLAGTTLSNDKMVYGNHGANDVWIVKLNAAGDTVWTRTYGGSADDAAASIVATADGGYAIGGYTLSNDGDAHGNHGSADLWVLKLNASGDTIWTRTYGGSLEDRYGFLVTTPDGGYALAGYTASNDGDVHGNHGGADMLLLRLNAQGDLLWSKTYGGSNLDEPRSLTTTPEGGFVLAGLTASNDKDVTGFHTPPFVGFDAWIVKVDGNGNKLWANTIGGTGDDVAISVIAAPGGYVMTGYTTSTDGDVKGYHGTISLFNDVLVAKLDDNGNKLWAHAYGGTLDEVGLSVIATTDGGYTVAGGASSKNGDVSGYQDDGGPLDMWIIKLDGSGNKQWGKLIGGSGDDYCFSILPAPDGYFLAGLTNSSDRDMVGSATHGDYDIWVTKLLVQ